MINIDRTTIIMKGANKSVSLTTLTTLRLSTYSHSHYRDEPNKEMHATVIYTTCYTYSKHKNKPN